MRYLIKVPASSANIGPGFDTLGIAWELFLNIYIDTEIKEKEIKNKNKNDIQKNDLFIRSLNYTLEYLQEKEATFSIELSSDIPIGKGLGSSAAAIIGGIYAAEIISNKRLNNFERLNIAVNFENHIDNLSACLEGGIVICSKNNDGLIYERLPVNYDIWGLLYVPPYSIPTEKARKILPQKYSKEDIVFNLQKLCTLLLGFIKKDEKLINIGLDDRIHQPYRFKLIKEYQLIKEELQKYNKKIVLSGAGPSLLSLFFYYEEALEILKKVENNLKEKINGEFKILKINYKGVIVEKI